MHTSWLMVAATLLAFPVYASETDSHVVHEHAPYYVIAGEIDGADGRNGMLTTWDAFGWIGGDYDKFWWRTEGEREAGETEEAEVWGLYSRNIANFWDVQVGLRHDIQPETTSYAVIGVQGLSRYFFESDAHIFVSDDGDITARLEQSIDLLLTQRLITEPYLEVNLAAQDIPELGIGAGISDYEIGLQTRYEITRKFAPYLDLNYTQLIGESRRYARSDEEGTGEITARVGLRFWF